MRKLIYSCLIALLCAAPLASRADEEDMLALIVSTHQTGRISNVSDLALVYRRKRLLWEGGGRIQPVNLPPENPLRQVFSQRVLNNTPQELSQYWSTMYFHGISPPHVLASQEAVLRFVAETPGAIGYVSACKADHRVKPVLWLLPNGDVSRQAPELKCPDL